MCIFCVDSHRPAAQRMNTPHHVFPRRVSLHLAGGPAPVTVLTQNKSKSCTMYLLNENSLEFIFSTALMRWRSENIHVSLELQGGHGLLFCIRSFCSGTLPLQVIGEVFINTASSSERSRHYEHKAQDLGRV